MEKPPSEYEGRVAPNKDWREIVAWVGDLPPMPAVAAQAISLVEQPTTTAQKLNDLLSKDPALAARVLKIANSAMFSRQREIKTLNQAVMVIGFKALKGIIVAATLRQLNKRFGKTEQVVWENSTATAMCATVLARKLKKRYVDEIFLLGLLHTLGQIVLLTQEDSAKIYNDVLKKIKGDETDYVVAETEIFGFAHPLIGALVAKKWNFSAETCQVILHYQDDLEGAAPTSEQEEKTAIVQLADAVSHMAGIGSPDGYQVDMKKVEKCLTYLQLSSGTAEETLEELVNQTKEMFEEKEVSTDSYLYKKSIKSIYILFRLMLLGLTLPLTLIQNELLV